MFDPSAPYILRPGVWIPSTPSSLLSIYIIVWREKDESNQKEAGIGSHYKNILKCFVIS